MITGHTYKCTLLPAKNAKQHQKPGPFPTFKVEFKVAEDERAPRQGDLQVSGCGSLHILDVLAGKPEHHLAMGKRGAC